MSLTLLWNIIMHSFYSPHSAYPADNGSSKLVRGIFSYNFSAAAESSAKTELHSVLILNFPYLSSLKKCFQNEIKQRYFFKKYINTEILYW